MILNKCSCWSRVDRHSSRSLLPTRQGLNSQTTFNCPYKFSIMEYWPKRISEYSPDGCIWCIRKKCDGFGQNVYYNTRAPGTTQLRRTWKGTEWHKSMICESNFFVSYVILFTLPVCNFPWCIKHYDMVCWKSYVLVTGKCGTLICNSIVISSQIYSFVLLCCLT